MLCALAASGLGALAWWLGPHNASANDVQARDSAGRLLLAAADWKRATTLHGCPTISQLKVDQQLTRDTPTQDPWGQRFRILCTDAGVSVLSAGADQKFQTNDDIRLADDGQT